MRKIEEIFPLKGIITDEIINESDIMNPFRCIGAVTLKNTLEKSSFSDQIQNICWDATEGFIITEEKEIKVSTNEGIDMIEVKDPTDVTFIILEINKRLIVWQNL